MKQNNEQSWNKYWGENEDKNSLSKVYDVIASFYRNRLIGPRLHHTLQIEFPNCARLIHAGSGAGEVDSHVPNNIEVLAVDISLNAVERYRKLHPKQNAIQMDIFNLSQLPEKYDGLYNLGVMEHFSLEECSRILKSANEALKVGGKVILFWPPHYGISVIFLHAVHFLLRIIKKGEFEPLHPEEPNKASTKRKARELLQGAGFELTGFSFSPRDFFTYIVITGIKR
jgi:2-polyprenyl-3-methyl-5-hydroxy-6-metoxy-1,4-benzoquinol methylase